MTPVPRVFRIFPSEYGVVSRYLLPSFQEQTRQHISSFTLAQCLKLVVIRKLLDFLNVRRLILKEMMSALKVGKD